MIINHTGYMETWGFLEYSVQGALPPLNENEMDDIDFENFPPPPVLVRMNAHSYLDIDANNPESLSQVIIRFTNFTFEQGYRLANNLSGWDRKKYLLLLRSRTGNNISAQDSFLVRYMAEFL